MRPRYDDCYVRISYEAGGQNYDITERRHYESNAAAERCARTNRVGKRRRVYYLYADPGVGRIDRALFGNWAEIVPFFLMVPFGAALAVFAWRTHRRLGM